MKSILFSSTRQWNPGDEIIYFGVRNLLHGMGIEFNPVLYNRHVLINPNPYQVQYKKEIPFYVDNSFMMFDFARNTIDYVIFAGTPEWSGKKVNTLFEFIEQENLRFSMIGVGGANRDPRVPRLVQKYADVITVRDQLALEELGEFGAILDTCSALFCSLCIDNLDLSPLNGLSI